MKLKVLNNLKDNVPLRDITFTSIKKKESSNIMKQDCFILLGSTNEEIVNLLNSSIGSKAYYKNIYTDRLLTVPYRNTRKVFKLNEYYKDLLAKIDTPLMYKKTIKEYNGKNIYYNTYPMVDFFFSNLNVSGTKRLDLFINLLVSLASKVSGTYKNLSYVVPIDLVNIKESKSFNSLSKLSPNVSQYFFFILKNRDLYEKFISRLREAKIKEVTILFKNTNRNIFFKFSIDTTKDNEVIINGTKLMKQYNLLRRLNMLNTADGSKEEETLKKEIIQAEADEEVTSTNVGNTKKAIHNEIEINKINKAEEIITDVKKLLNINKVNTIDNKIISKMSDRVLILLQDIEDTSDDKTILDILDNDDDFKIYLDVLNKNNKVGIDEKELKRIDDLLKTQSKAEIGGKSIKEIADSHKDIEIKHEVLPHNNNIFDNTRSNNLKDFDSSYVKNSYDKDIYNTLLSFNKDKDIPMYITSINKEDTSDNMTRKNTYHIVYKDVKNVKHTINIDIPIILDDKYVYINGSKKLIQKQLILKPIVKTKPDTVQITTDYNKFFITRFGHKLAENIEAFKKFFLDDDFKKYLHTDSSLKILKGDVSAANKRYSLDIFYYSFSEFLTKIETKDLLIGFNFKELQDMNNNESSVDYDVKLASFNELYDHNKYDMIGYFKSKKEIILVNKSTTHIEILDDNAVIKNSKSNLANFIASILKQEVNTEDLNRINLYVRPKTVTYNRIEITNKTIPLVIVLGYEYGLIETLERYKVNYIFSSTLKKPNILSENTMRIKFNNGYLYYDNTNIRMSLLLSGLSALSTEEYDYRDFEKNGPAYIDFFSDRFGSRNTGKGIHNTLSLMIDPKTEQILTKLNLPTDIFDLLLLANTMLETNAYNAQNEMVNYRIRGTEQVNAILYKILADSYRTYKDTSKNGSPIKVSVPQNILLKKLTEVPTVDEASDLNPTLELEKVFSATYKGPNGLNNEDAFTKEIRSYDTSMKGLLASESPDNDKVGVVRFLTYNPSIMNTLGFIDPDPNRQTDNATDIYSLGELMNPFTSKHADWKVVCLYVIFLVKYSVQQTNL